MEEEKVKAEIYVYYMKTVGKCILVTSCFWVAEETVCHV